MLNIWCKLHACILTAYVMCGMLVAFSILFQFTQLYRNTVHVKYVVRAPCILTAYVMCGMLAFTKIMLQACTQWLSRFCFNSLSIDSIL